MSKLDLNDAVNALKGHTPVELEWLQEPYCGAVIIKEIHYSENHKYQNGDPYKGTPYFKFLVHTKTERKFNIMLWRPKAGETPEKSQRKLDKIKRFLEHAEVDETKDNEEYFNSVIGKEVQVVLQKQDQLDLEKVPKIVSRISFWFSKPMTETLSMDLDKMNVQLSPADIKKFDEAKLKYEKENPEPEEKGAIDAAASDFEGEGKEDF